MADGLAIVNAALIELGAAPLLTLDDQTISAARVRAVWPALRLGVLRVHPWNCCADSATLNPNQLNPRRFELPGDFVRLLAVEPSSMEYTLTGSALLTTIASSRLEVRYVADKPVDEWDPLVHRYAVLSLAHALCYSFTGSATLREQFGREAAYALTVAKGADGSEQPMDDLLGVDALRQARYG